MKKFTVYKAGKTDPREAFVIKNPRKSKSGREFGYIDQENRDRGEIIIWIKGDPRAPFGAEVREFKDGGESCTLAVCFDGAVPEGEPGHDQAQFNELKFLTDLDEMMIRHAMENPNDFLGRVRPGTSEEKLRRLALAAYSPLIRPGRTNPTTGKQYAPLFQAKVPISDGLPTVPVRLKIGKNKRKHVAPEDVLDLLGRNTRCRFTFKIRFIWFRTTGATKKFGISREVTSIEILPTRNMNRVIDPKDFDTSKLVIESDYMNPYGSPMARVSYNGVQLVVFAPKGTVMGSHVTGLGIEQFEENSGNPFFRIMWNDRNDPDVRALVAVLDDLTKTVMDVAYDRRESWFGDDGIDKDDVQDYLNPMMRQMDDRQDGYTRNDDEPVYIKIKLPFAQGSTDDEPEFRSKFQDRDGVEIKGRDVYDALSRGVDASVTFKARPVYVMQRSMYGIPFEAVTVTIDISLAEIEANAGKTVNAEDRLFEDDDEDEDEDEDEDCEETVAVAAATATNSTTTTTTTTDEVSTETTVDDDDDDEDYVDEEDGDEYTDDSDEDAAGDEIVAHA